MPTHLQRPVTRQTEGRHRGRPLVVTLYPGDIIGVRQARTRTEYTIPLAWVYDAAVKAEVTRQRAEKAKRKRERR